MNKKEDKKEIEEKVKFFECACKSLEHLFILRFDYEDDDLYIEVHLDILPWHKRIINGIKHIFGYRSMYGCFGCWMGDKKTAKEMIDVLQKYIDN